MIRVLIADDEALARDALRIRLADAPGFEVVAQCGDGFEAVDAILGCRPDLAFLDIRMPGASGFDVLSALAPAERPAVVFVTAHDDRAVDAFTFEAVDYLLKPFDTARFEQTLDRVRRRLSLHPRRGANEQGPPEGVRRWLIARVGSKARLVRVEDVVWFGAAGDYVEAHLRGRVELLDKNLKELATSLPQERFVRIHRSTIVNVENITDLSTVDGRDWEVALDSGDRLRMSRTYRPALERVLNERL